VDVVELISGESPKLKTCALVRKGEGFKITRNAAYDYKHLAFTFRDKKAEPCLVTVEPKEGEVPALHTHEGQEVNYMVSGRMEFHLGGISYELEEGDSVYFDSGIPHAARALGAQPAKFIAVVVN
jgi:quercetin dioxygenase-like cupin family protein